ncbi:MAG: PilZ domain-containing protein [Spirochaetales bacterium]|nr:PilZ domain-containing protein [Spirochaetales bacterium]
MEEKREQARYQIRQFVKIDFNREEFLPAEGLNISANGLLCRVPRPLSPGQRLFLMLNLGTPRDPIILNVEALIIWTKTDHAELPSWLAGVEFLDLTENQKEQILAFLAYDRSRVAECPET